MVTYGGGSVMAWTAILWESSFHVISTLLQDEVDNKAVIAVGGNWKIVIHATSNILPVRGHG